MTSSHLHIMDKKKVMGIWHAVWGRVSSSGFSLNPEKLLEVWRRGGVGILESCRGTEVRDIYLYLLTGW